MCRSAEKDRQLYELYGKLNTYKYRVTRALQICADALKNSARPLTSFSGGKDSIVMLDIAVKAGFKGELMFFQYGYEYDETPPETYEILAYYAAKHGLKVNFVKCLSEFDCWHTAGRFFLFPETDEERKLVEKCDRDYVQKAKRFQEEYGCDLLFIGMRKKESRARRIMLSKNRRTEHGDYTYDSAARTCLTCCPIAEFTGADIWAHIFINCLAYPSFYDYPYVSREVLRNEPTLLCNDAIIRHGNIDVFKAVFPDYIGEIKRRYPDAAL